MSVDRHQYFRQVCHVHLGFGSSKMMDNLACFSGENDDKPLEFWCAPNSWTTREGSRNNVSIGLNVGLIWPDLA